MRLVVDSQGLRCTDHVEIVAALGAVVAKATTSLAAPITVEPATGICGGGEELERVRFVAWMGDEGRHMGAWSMEGEVATLARVDES